MQIHQYRIGQAGRNDMESGTRSLQADGENGLHAPAMGAMDANTGMIKKLYQSTPWNDSPHGKKIIKSEGFFAEDYWYWIAIADFGFEPKSIPDTYFILTSGAIRGSSLPLQSLSLYAPFPSDAASSYGPSHLGPSLPPSLA
ncbi:gypsy type transposase [Tanacetum coccineum]